MTVLMMMMVDSDDVRNLTPRASVPVAADAPEPVPEDLGRIGNPMLAHAGRLMIRVIPILLLAGI